MQIPDENIYTSTILCTFHKPAFIENIAGDDQGNLYVTSVDEGRVYKVDPMGNVEEYASVTGKLTGIAIAGAGRFLCSGWAADGIPTIYLLDEHRNLIPKLSLYEAQFLNGVTTLAPGSFLICDAYAGLLWKYDLASNKATPWKSHELLTRLDPDDPMPAANGVKIHEETVFVSNTARNLLLKIPIEAGLPGEPEIFLDKVNLDDFAIAGDGHIFATTHIFNSVIEITPGGKLYTIGGLDQGLSGSTAAIFGRTDKDRKTLYVTTNGGISYPPAGGLQDGKIVKIEIP